MLIQRPSVTSFLVILTTFSFWLIPFKSNAIKVDSLPPNMYADTAFAPFLHGVASGDPLPNKVLIWTRITPDSTNTSSLAVDYEVANTQSFSQLQTSGTFVTDSTRDWTVKVDVGGLSPDTRYYYRFISSSGDTSRVGRTRTAPTGNVDHLRFGIASCASVYSGYFNAYRRIGERDSLHAFIHLGDYIYDYVDEDEEVRVPSPYPTRPGTIEEYRDRHAYYLLDPDFRYARQQHPFIVTWDNHDVNDTSAFEGSKEAFQEWVPMRLPDTTNRERIYRTFQYGNLVDLILLDVLLYRNQETHPAGDTSMLGLQQYNWFLDQLDSSDAKWRVIGSQNMMGGWSAKNVPSGAPVPTDGDVFDDTSWDGFQGERTKLFDYWEQNGIINNIVVSGDSHVSVAMDLTQDFLDGNTYNSATGDGSLGVEFLPASISRGNLDERGIDSSLLDVANNISMNGNPHHQYAQFTKHGYGILDVRKDSAEAEFCYSKILQKTSQEEKGASLVVMDSANHWKRSTSTGIDTKEKTADNEILSVYPNPTKSQLTIKVDRQKDINGILKICDLAGKCHIEEQIANPTSTVDISELNSGVYSVIYYGKNRNVSTRLVIQ